MSFSKREKKSGIYTPENVFNTLNSELKDSERRHFLAALVNSKDAINLLITAMQKWDKLLFKQKLEITSLEDMVRVSSDSLKLQVDKALLSSKKIEQEKSTNWALQTRTMMQEILNLDEKEGFSLSL